MYKSINLLLLVLFLVNCAPPNTLPVSDINKGTQSSQKVSALINMVKVDGGIFSMGDIAGNGWPEEKPIHQVTLSDFYISKYELTQKEYFSVMKGLPTYWDTISESFRGDNIPMSVTWIDSIKFCNALSKIEGLPPAYDENTNNLIDYSGKETTDLTKVKGYRLPTEAEWEYSARGGNKSKGYIYSGSNNLDDVAWFGTLTGRPLEVGKKSSNELGLFDMSGNVSEWCTDWYDDNFYSTGTLKNPFNNTQVVNYRSARGGTINLGEIESRVSGRAHGNQIGDMRGIRIVKEG